MYLRGSSWPTLRCPLPPRAAPSVPSPPPHLGLTISANTFTDFWKGSCPDPHEPHTLACKSTPRLSVSILGFEGVQSRCGREGGTVEASTAGSASTQLRASAGALGEFAVRGSRWEFRAAGSAFSARSRRECSCCEGTGQGLSLNTEWQQQCLSPSVGRGIRQSGGGFGAHVFAVYRAFKLGVNKVLALADSLVYEGISFHQHYSRARVSMFNLL